MNIDQDIKNINHVTHHQKNDDSCHQINDDTLHQIQIIEKFSDNDDAIITSVLGVIHFIGVIIAIALSFRCNRGFKLLPFIIAICCPWLYIIYALVGMHKDFCPKPYKH